MLMVKWSSKLYLLLGAGLGGVAFVFGAMCFLKRKRQRRAMFRHGGHCGQGSPTRALGPSTGTQHLVTAPTSSFTLTTTLCLHLALYPDPVPRLLPTASPVLSTQPLLVRPRPDSAASPPSCRPGCSKANGPEALDSHSSSWCCWVCMVTLRATRRN